MSKEYRIYFEKRFYKQKDGYWCCTDNKFPHAHRWVWINFNGDIPEGCHIHHIDHDPDNNNIENLECLTLSDHIKRHWKENTYDLEQRRAQLDEARKWLSTEEGRLKQKTDATEGWKKRKKTIINCQFCGTEKETSQPWAKFCGQNCYMKHRRSLGIDNIKKICEFCGNEFVTGKHAKHRFCSISCGAKNSRRRKA